MEDSSPDAILSIEDAFYEARMFKAFGADQYPQSVSIADRFELLERIGKGSYGTVFLAQDHELERKVAVKVMPLGDPHVAEREGKLLAQLRHPNIVRIHDHGTKDDYRWLVLELLEGPTLGEWCRGKSTKAILERYLEAGKGLEAAHRHGMAHRDFKPGNVRLDDQGRAVVLDFGLARNLESLQGEAGSPDQVYGTFAYLPPEALRGQRTGEKGDQFSYCVSLWEALSGLNPFALDGRDLEARFHAIQAPPRGGERLPRRVRQALERGMSPLPGDRWPTMGGLLDVLGGASKVRRWPWVLGSIVTVGLLSLNIVYLWSVRERAPVVLPDELPKLELVEALRARDHKEALQALQDSYLEAARQDRETDFISFAVAVATHLEAAAKPVEAAEAWLLVSHLAAKSGDSQLFLSASDKVSALLGRVRAVPSPRSR
ncbi:serine/threonine kinase family protein [Plesiocystis pacifica SIR-1]|uniref:Serine/threonine kinase family protein n=1 Tax=Plesiocystis pacifica SIR-1 TaxID=391625 RepID=A6GBQ0_9BACT|nr:serine/threonine-protein kinase [Plesiocystis pacifica]EDM76667.1 serine/threonine kinase family protein [Plesiocystis pacifica SIR-1]